MAWCLIKQEIHLHGAVLIPYTLYLIPYTFEKTAEFIFASAVSKLAMF
jgi:hypothetical protein